MIMTPPITVAPLICVAGVSLTLGEGEVRTHILKSVSLTLEPGTSVAVLGPSGSGKSSLMAVIAGLERADSGRVTLSGADLAGLDEDQLARLRGRSLGIILQSFQLLPTVSAVENVAVPLELAGASDARERAESELEAVGLGHRLHHYPAQLSGGEQQRVALARALAPDPAILVADEPTGNLDESTGKQIIELLFAGHEKRGTTLVLVTHDNALAKRCDRTVRLRSGRIETAETSALREVATA